jgi:hypothetical protein
MTAIRGEGWAPKAAGMRRVRPTRYDARLTLVKARKRAAQRSMRSMPDQGVHSRSIHVPWCSQRCVLVCSTGSFSSHCCLGLGSSLFSRLALKAPLVASATINATT